ncbi:peptide antibiotic transporter SbmA [Bradyrhizobium sp. dw_411]|uniref:peptide antibiotic transporter SbmA n=1 Tax=Bradyrhizobium sp. dw_411 TaxID=2720082 RepID=UPI001BCDA51A|nr:peptide antibiotic transporter SbmA [Bradyrhizobium sp. dw_411]
MFVSFFPRPKLFFWSAVIWAALSMAFWYGFASNLVDASSPAISVARFWSVPELWFDLYFAICVALFAGAWMWFAPHPWAPWSIIGSALILFTSYFQVQVSVALNDWRGPFYNLIQSALTKPGSATQAEFYAGISTFAGIATVAILVIVLTRFFVSHYIFRWRTAMNDYYVANWPRLRTIEGASQRVQEDTMRFATIMEGLGVNLISAVLTLIAFLPVLIRLSSYVTELPFVGSIPYPLVFAAVIWSVFGTGALALIGIRLPGIEFFNQRVEAAYRKELVLGEDDPAHAEPPTLSMLFVNIRRNYFRLYLNFMYFNVGRYVYLQTDVIFPYILLVPTIVAGKITLGIMQQILAAFSEVRSSFQYLVNSWSTIVDLISIYQRLRGFEARIHDKPLPSIETEAEPASL